MIYQQFRDDPAFDPLVLRDIVTRLMNVPFRTKLLKQQPLKQEAQQLPGTPQGMPKGMNPMMQGLPNPNQLAQVFNL